MKIITIVKSLVVFLIVSFGLSDITSADYFSEHGRTQELRQRELDKRWDYMEKGNPSQNKSPDIDMGGKESWDSYKGTFYLSGDLGYATFYFSSVNSYINDVNDELANRSIDTLSSINGGLSGGGSIAYWINHRVILGGSFRYLSAHTLRSGDGLGDELKLSVTEYNFLLKFGRGLSPDFVFFVGIEPGFIQYSNASISRNREALGDNTTTEQLGDSQFGVKITTAIDYKIKQDVAFGIELGYRTYSHLKFDVDYTGFFAQTGIRLYLK